jgi:hypothetical protein
VTAATAQLSFSRHCHRSNPVEVERLSATVTIRQPGSRPRYGNAVPLVAAAVCPHPPMIVPQVASGARDELDGLRTACAAALDALWRSPARRVVVIAADARTRVHDFPFAGSFAPWGVPVEARLGTGPATGGLPLGGLVATWLLQRHGPDRPVAWAMRGIAADAAPDTCAELLAGEQPTPYALLVMGDGAACHGPKAPGYDDPRAGPYDRAVAAALRDADPDALLALDPALSAELLVAGRAPWQVLAGAARAAGGGWRGTLCYDAAPYGVGYLVAGWERP